MRRSWWVSHAEARRLAFVRVQRFAFVLIGHSDY